MEKITFSTVLGTAVTIDDVNTSSDADGYIPLHLLSFEGNALGYKHDSSERVGFDGAGFYGAKANIRTITAEIALLPRSGKPATMYELRRKLLRYFPAGVEGTLKYTNSAGKTYQIEGVVSELPAVERQVGVLCTAKVSILSYVPFWRVKADDVELTADAGATQDISFTAGTEEKIPAASKKSNTEIAKEVIRGSWGNGVERKQRLTAAGYNYTAVQAEVDRMLGKKTSTVSKPAKISKGDRVKIKQGATWYGGTKVLTGWLLEKTWIVDEIVGNRAVLGKDTTGVFNIQSPIDVKYLKK